MFNSSFITKVEDCDTILAEAGKIKSNLEIKLLGLQRQLTNQFAQANSLPAALTEAVLAMTAEGQFLNSLPPSKRRDSAELRVNDLENEIRAINAKIKNFGPVAYAKRSREIAYTESCILKINEVIAAIELRKSEIQTAAAA
jgi:hypothetical protein